MKVREVKLVRVGKDTVVGFSTYNGYGVASMMLDAEGKKKQKIEQDFILRFRSQIVQKRKTKNIGTEDNNAQWECKWFEFEDVSKEHAQQLMEPICVQKPKVYSIEKKSDGSLKVHKVESKLYDEDELKIALCKMALED